MGYNSLADIIGLSSFV